MSEELLKFPKARLSLGAGDLIDVFDVVLAIEDGIKLISTLRGNPAGYTGGVIAATLTWKSYISELGFERDYMQKWRKKEAVQTRLKVPGVTFTTVGPLTKPQITGNVENAVEFQVSQVGNTTPE
jgi:hypothetical protein